MIAQMIRCPTCSGLAEPKARFCTGCYTVFPSDNRPGYRRFEGATKNKASSWKGPSLFFAVLLAVWFIVDADDWAAEPGSYRAMARDAKRGVLVWVDNSTKNWRGNPSGADDPAWPLDNDDLLPCGRGLLCDAVIHFDAGQSAAFVIERPNSGAARIIARDSRGAELLGGASRAQLVVAPPRRVAQTISIARKNNDRWSIIDEAQLTPTGVRAGHPDNEEAS